MLLGDNEEADLRDLAVRVECLWAMHAHRQVGSIAVVEPAEDPAAVAAVEATEVRVVLVSNLPVSLALQA